MKTNYLILFLILPTFIFGQEIIQRTRKLSNQDCKEIYNVLKSDKSKLHGSYTKVSSKGTVYSEGFYKYGAKDSTWKDYNWNGKISKIGRYVSNKKVGLWNFFDENGNPQLTYNFSANEVVDFKLDDKEKNKKYNITTTQGVILEELDRPPFYLGSKVDIEIFIGSNLKYPIIALENGVSGKVVIAFTIDSIGQTSNYRVTDGIGSGCNEEALKVVKMLPERWLPGIYKGHAVTVQYFMPVFFRMN